MKRIILLLIMLSFLPLTPIQAALFNTNYNYYPQGLATFTGRVDSMGRNFIRVLGEYDKRIWRFVYFGRGDIHPGDYVRLFYDPQSRLVRVIKKLTVLEYRKSQNLGYILHKHN